MAYQSCPEHGGPINLCPYAHLPDPEPVLDPVESVSAAHPMRPWRWDAGTFKAFQGSTADEQAYTLSVLRQHGLAQAWADSSQAMQNDPDRFYRMQPRPASGGFWSQLLGLP